MYECPRCRLELTREYGKNGYIHRCATCAGEAVSGYVMEHAVGTELAESLRKLGVSGRRRSRCHCPECERRMLEVPLAAGDETFEIDYCRECRMFWFDAGEFSALPRDRAGEVVSRSPDGASAIHEAVAMAEVDRLRDELDRGEPAEGWKEVVGFLGFPVEYGHYVTIQPVVTWSVAVACALLSFGAFWGNEHLVGILGFVPAHPLRLGGVDWFTSFLMHADWLHLVGNLYFLCVFGDNVEERLGGRRFLLLLLAGHLGGLTVHGLFDPHPNVPCVGASAGISAVLVYYALQFSNAKIGFMWWIYWQPRWISISAGWVLAFWVVEQIYIVTLQLQGWSCVSGLGHMGGAVAGLGFWWWIERRRVQTVAGSGCCHGLR